MGFKNKTPGCSILFRKDPLESKYSLYSVISSDSVIFSLFNTYSVNMNLPHFTWLHFPCPAEKKCPINIY